ncbi:UDP-glucuronic acid decarboxylase family protein [Luteimonas suaedae]|uniref:UDP-glucuronic acid decarboxylase family protein n=1 Tax=Luteimonas suaedae TaxID=2605430 RepID=UPI0011ED35E0|nr:UDP-glucuronic acid decarboxylase family protein [Luteimonas suaedae]
MDGANGERRTRPAGRAIVTGGAGFLGSHLCRRLVADGCSVVAIDDLSTGDPRNLASLMTHERFDFIEHDITQPLHIRADAIFNLACCASPIHYQADPLKTLRTCVDGAANVLRLARECGARVLQASTSEVYGEPEVHPQSESYRGAVSATGPRACYDEGKRCAETLFFDCHRLYGTEIKVARIFNTYGPQMRADDGRVVSTLIVQALAGEPMTVNGDGIQTRSFCYVDDLVEGLVRLMRTPPEVTGPVNLGNPGEVTMLELAERIRELTGARGGIVHRPMPEDDPTRRCPDITLAKRLLAWSPQVPLDEGLARTVDWFRRLHAGRAARRTGTTWREARHVA